MDSPEMYEMFFAFKATLILCHWDQIAMMEVWQDYRVAKILGKDFYYVKKKI